MKIATGGITRGVDKRKPTALKLLGGLSKLDLENLPGSLAVFYVEQVALNRHATGSIYSATPEFVK
jgi:hypothetical protein